MYSYYITFFECKSIFYYIVVIKKFLSFFLEFDNESSVYYHPLIFLIAFKLRLFTNIIKFIHSHKKC